MREQIRSTSLASNQEVSRTREVEMERSKLTQRVEQLMSELDASKK